MTGIIMWLLDIHSPPSMMDIHSWIAVSAWKMPPFNRNGVGILLVLKISQHKHQFHNSIKEKIYKLVRLFYVFYEESGSFSAVHLYIYFVALSSPNISIWESCHQHMYSVITQISEL